MTSEATITTKAREYPEDNGTDHIVFVDGVERGAVWEDNATGRFSFVGWSDNTPEDWSTLDKASRSLAAGLTRDQLQTAIDAVNALVDAAELHEDARPAIVLVGDSIGFTGSGYDRDDPRVEDLEDAEEIDYRADSTQLDTFASAAFACIDARAAAEAEALSWEARS